jgi:hypothetical protein
MGGGMLSSNFCHFEQNQVPKHSKKPQFLQFSLIIMFWYIMQLVFGYGGGWSHMDTDLGDFFGYSEIRSDIRKFG